MAATSYPARSVMLPTRAACSRCCQCPLWVDASDLPPTADITRLGRHVRLQAAIVFGVYSLLPELTIGLGVAFKGKESVVQCPNETNIIVAITSTETRKGEAGVSKFIPSHLICRFCDEPFFA